MARIGAVRGGASKSAPQRKPAQNPFAAPVGGRLGNLTRPVAPAKPVRKAPFRPKPAIPLYDSPALIRAGAVLRSSAGRRYQVSQFNKATTADKYNMIRRAAADPTRPESNVLLRHLWDGKGYTPERGAQNASLLLPENFRPAGGVLDIPGQGLEAVHKLERSIAGSGAVKWLADRAGSNYDKQTGAPTIAAATGWTPGKSVAKIGANLPGSALAFPAMAVLGPADMAARAVRQDSVGAALASPFKDVYNAGKQIVTHPVRSLENDPVGTTLMAAAPVAAFGRGGGALARGGLFGKGAKAYANTARSPLQLGRVVDDSGNVLSEGISKPRHYSKNIIVQTAQKVGDRRERPRTVDEIRQGLERKQVTENGVSRSETNAEMLARAEKIATAERGSTGVFGPGAGSVYRGAVGEAKRMGNEIADVNEVLRREDQRNAANDTRASAPYGNQKVLAIHGEPFGKTKKAANDIVSEVLSGSVLPSSAEFPTRFRDTLSSRLNELKQAQKSLRGAELKYSKELSSNIERVLAESDKGLAGIEARVVKAAHEIGPRKNKADATIIDRGLGLDPLQVEARRVAPYAIRHMGARFDEEAGTFVDRNGAALGVDRIKYDMKQNGIEPDNIAYVNTQQGTEGSRNFFTPWRGSRGQVASGQFTGATFRRGAFPSKFENLVEQSAKDAGLVRRAKAHDQMVSDFGIKKDLGGGKTGFFNGKEAVRVARSMSKNNANGITYQAIRVHPLSADQAVVEKFQSPSASIDSTKLLSDWDKRRFETPDSTDLSVIVPSQIVNQVVKQNRAGRPPGAIVGGAFRRTVLALHTTWMTGNIVEALLRSLVSGVNPNHYRIGKLVMKELRNLDEEAAARLEARAIGGTMFGTQKRMATRSQAGIVLRKVPALGQAITFGEELTNAIFGINRGAERQFQYASLGKHAQREMQEFTNSWVQANQATTELLKSVAEGYLDEAKQIEAARYVDDVLGKYSKFDPKMRQFIQGYAIFLPWALNAVRFFTFTLPIKHPVQAALLVSSEKMIDQETKDAANSQPGNLRSELQVDGGIRQIGRYTPAGLFLGSAKWQKEGGYDAIYNPLGMQAAKQILPEFSTAIAMLSFGVNWKGQKAIGHDGQAIGNRPALALYQFAEGLTPGLAMLRQWREHGGKPYDDSTVFNPRVKPGTTGSKGFADSFNPFRVIKTGSTNKSPYADWGKEKTKVDPYANWGKEKTAADPYANWGK